MRVFLLDNYDSFTYNLVQYLRELGAEVVVERNDGTTPAGVLAGGYDRIVISPGPGTAERAGISLDLIGALAARPSPGAAPPVLGVCLGHQAIARWFGAVVDRASEPVHGKTALIHHDGRTVFRGLPDPFEATRYHSLAVRPESVPACLEVSARTPGGVVMGLRHRSLPIEGVQFHPESILTGQGRKLLANFLDARGRPE